METRGRFIRLRALEREDMEKLRGYHNDPGVARFLGGWCFPITRDEQLKWYDRINGNELDQRFAIDHPERGFIGISTLTGIDLRDRRAFHGVIIGEKDLHGQGIGRDVVMTTMRLAFEELQLVRLDGEIIEGNDASRRLYCDKCGWVVEGVRRKHAFRENTYRDRLIVGIMAEEYYALCERTGYWC